MGVKFIKKILITSILLVVIIFTISCAQATEITDNNNVSMEISEYTGNTVELDEKTSIDNNYSIENDANCLSACNEDDANNVSVSDEEITSSIEDNYTSTISVSTENIENLTKVNTIEYSKKVIDCSKTKGVYLIDNNYKNIIFKNITFKDTVFFYMNNESNDDLNITMIDCTFSSSEETYDNVIAVDSDFDVKFSSNKISSEIITLAESIVGRSKGMDAIEKLSYWVTNNIAHESKPGFYQTPSQTLKRKIGNCCCHSELFLHMCVAIGIDKEYKLGFVHVGNMGYGYRHYFVLIDNICIDTDAALPDPMFYGAGLDWGVYQITKYPILPFE